MCGCGTRVDQYVDLYDTEYEVPKEYNRRDTESSGLTVEYRVFPTRMDARRYAREVEAFDFITHRSSVTGMWASRFMYQWKGTRDSR